MRYRSLVLAVTAALALGAVAAEAQQRSGGGSVPAEIPPDSFTGNQYVDSRGCVYIRVGYGGATNWVPRVSRSREQLCGYRPSLSPSELAALRGAPAPAPDVPEITAAPAPVPTPAPATETARTSPAPAAPRPARPATARVTPAPTGRSTAATAPRPTTMPRTSTTVIRTEPAPAATVAAAAPVPVAPGETGEISCRWVSRDGRVTLLRNGNNARCTAQAIHPGDLAAAAAGGGVGRAAGDPSGLIVPVQPSIPPGYRAAWEDGRLNPQRGPRTARGEAQMNMVWTDTVPRRLVEWTPAADGVAAPRVTASTRRPEAAGAGLPIGHRYLRAANYRTLDQADAAQDRLMGAGVAAAIGRIDRPDGAIYTLLAGPFESPAALARAVRAARAAGFANVTTR